MQQILLRLSVIAGLLMGGAPAAAQSSYIELLRNLPGFGPPRVNPADETPFVFTMAGTKFSIPRNYIASRKLPPEGSSMDDGLHLMMLWPGLEPYREDNAEEFRKKGWGRQIQLILTPKESFLLGRDLFALLWERTNRESCRDIKPLYRICSKVLGNRDDELRIIGDDPVPFFVACSIEGTVPFPGCDRHMEITPGNRLSYSYSKVFVLEAQQIEEALIELFKGFIATDN